MIRTIVGFVQDEAGDFVAELSCLHRQHVRHRPPFVERPWVLEEPGRAAHLGSPIECPLCDRAELPKDLVLLRRAGPWDETQVPAGLRRRHHTAEGVWGVLRVQRGSVHLSLETDPRIDTLLEAGGAQAIPPVTPHALSLDGPVALELEFWGAG